MNNYYFSKYSVLYLLLCGKFNVLGPSEVVHGPKTLDFSVYVPTTYQILPSSCHYYACFLLSLQNESIYS